MQQAVKSIAMHIAKWKVETNSSDDDLAALLGRSRNCLQRKKLGKNEFVASELLTMCSIFGCDPNTLLGYSEEI